MLEKKVGFFDVKKNLKKPKKPKKPRINFKKNLIFLLKKMLFYNNK
tara:strand:+ start:10 stop:147 length:138 start_codon:yes stop_codon:yes gene_type:complete